MSCYVNVYQRVTIKPCGKVGQSLAPTCFFFIPETTADDSRQSQSGGCKLGIAQLTVGETTLKYEMLANGSYPLVMSK